MHARRWIVREARAGDHLRGLSCSMICGESTACSRVGLAREERRPAVENAIDEDETVEVIDLVEYAARLDGVGVDAHQTRRAGLEPLDEHLGRASDVTREIRDAHASFAHRDDAGLRDDPRPIFPRHVIGLPVSDLDTDAPRLVRIDLRSLDATVLAPHFLDGKLTHVDLSHLAATPPGFTVQIRSRLEAVEGRKLVFAVSAHDGVDTISEGRHERHVIEAARFEARLAAKAEARR